MSFQWKNHRVSAILLVALLFGAQLCHAADSQTPAISDVALHKGGTLVGQVLNSSSAAQANETVAISQNGKLVASVKTDKRGRFFFQGLRAGTYVIETKASNGLLRLWAPQTAPPAAKTGVVMVSEDDVVRGQAAVGPGFNLDTAIFLGVAGTGLGFGIYEVSKDDGTVTPPSS